MWTYNYTTELYHHGIKGQKWGVRRYQNSDGSLTAKGKQKYGDSNSKTQKKKSKHRMRLEQGYMKAGYSKEQAERFANGHIITEKVAVGVAAVALTACAVYVARNHLKDRTDSILKSGTSMQRIEGASTNTLHDVFYASAGKHDNARYEGLLGQIRASQYGEAYKMNIGVDKNIKIASNKKARDTFAKMYESNSEVKSYVDRIARAKGSSIPGDKKLSNKDAKKLYNYFNTAIVGRSPEGKKVYSEFFSELKKRGYSGIKDINDMENSGFNAKHPYILFDHASKVHINGVTKLNNIDVNKLYKSEYHKVLTENKTKKLTAKTVKTTRNVGIGSAAVATYLRAMGASVVSSSSKDNEKAEKKDVTK